ncbi:hypothetical protein [Deinococcus ruber]|uniref:TrbL/VirB6 plasmid conjugal transfer protein n=1 Tax=Deinococcus ruber TaxID=1848197 RepID=A0A918F6L3_9DEIO|nr:hypothetical protein [Deinococcus ruber]GGR09726.1 hypothetical protein GCM10008957_23100 [Deinococcus ruber]
MHRLFRFVLVLLLSVCPGMVSAAGLHSTFTTCGVHSTTPNVSNTSFDTLMFVPDAQCWFNNTVTEFAEHGVFHAVDTLSAAVMFLLFLTQVVIPFFTDPKSRGTRMILHGVTFLVFGSITSQAALNKPDNALDYIRGYMFTAWTQVYVASADAGNALVNGSSGPSSVVANLTNIATSIAQLQYDSSRYDRLKTQLMAAKINATSGGSASNLTDQVNQLIAQDKAAYKPDTSGGAWTNVGYFALLGVFAVFAAIVYATGLGVLVAALLLSIAFAFAAAGNFSALKTTLNTTLAALISTVILPFAVGITIDIAFGQPTASMSRNLAANNITLEADIQQFTQQYQACNWYEAACNVSNFENDFAATWEGVRSSWIGIFQIILGMMVTLGIGLSQLRRIPAMVSSMFGVSGGGESSGTGANPLGKVGEALGLAAATKAVTGGIAKRAMGVGAQKAGSGSAASSAGAEGGAASAGGSSSEGGSSGGGGGGDDTPKVIPPAATSGGSSPSAAQRLGAVVASARGGMSGNRLQMAAQGTAAVAGAAGRAAWGAAERADPSLRGIRENAGGLAERVQGSVDRTKRTAGDVRDLAQNGGMAVSVGMGVGRQQAARAASAAGTDQRAERATGPAASSTFEAGAARFTPPSAPATSAAPAVTKTQVGTSASGSGTPAPSNTPATPSAPSGPANNGGYQQTRPTPPATGPAAGVNTQGSGAVTPASVPATQQTRQVTQQHPSSASSSKASAGAGKQAPGGMNSGPSGRGTVISGKSGLERPSVSGRPNIPNDARINMQPHVAGRSASDATTTKTSATAPAPGGTADRSASARPSQRSTAGSLPDEPTPRVSSRLNARKVT